MTHGDDVIQSRRHLVGALRVAQLRLGLLGAQNHLGVGAGEGVVQLPGDESALGAQSLGARLEEQGSTTIALSHYKRYGEANSQGDNITTQHWINILPRPPCQNNSCDEQEQHHNNLREAPATTQDRNGQPSDEHHCTELIIG